ncbi:hypothetical protein TFLX_03449 [Thermoflexales bacterium]|nr:hypothetical protein TFLX_03449 [Thermoflexales bacterium]
MTYHIDAEKISLGDLRKRIEATDLVPSRVPLLDQLGKKMKALEQQGITTLARLRDELKNSKRLAAVANATGIDSQYLILLRREIESYFPKPFALKTFTWLPHREIAKLEQYGIRDTADLYEAASSAKSRTQLAKATGADAPTLEALARLADLTRVQWVSPTAARMLVTAAYDSAAKLAAANAEDVYEALIRVNDGDRFFKGKIGLRDVKRLVQAASYIPR